jgi:acyl-lipid omega-6 desaturase (Delta-12 desaturase)
LVAIRKPVDWRRLPTNARGFAWILCESMLTALAVGLSLVSSSRMASSWGWLPVWLLCQLALGLLFFQWFVLMHGCGHRALFASRRLNDIFGHVASLFCLIPFASWQYVHGQHHRWVGWIDKDPTSRALSEPLPSLYVQRVINFCWRFWIPIFSLFFAIAVFWNPRRVAIVAPSARQRRRTLLSILLPILVYVPLVAWMGSRFLEIWAVAFVCYLSIGDPVLLSQHVHVPWKQTFGEAVRPFSHAEQDRFSRTIIVPGWVAQWILLQFTTHGAHHAYPSIAHYDLARVPFESVHAIRWSEWLRAAKRMPAVRLLYENSNDTGVIL